jgi:hypothetical protein
MRPKQYERLPIYTAHPDLSQLGLGGSASGKLI